MRSKQKSFTSESDLPFQNEVVQLETYGYTWKRKIAIGLWLALLSVSAFIAYRCFSLFDEHLDYLLRVDLTLMANFEFDQAKTSFFIPIFDYARYPTALLTLWLAWRSFKAVYIAPIVRTEHVSIHMMRAYDPSNS
jgi:hypothetical protein